MSERIKLFVHIYQMLIYFYSIESHFLWRRLRRGGDKSHKKSKWKLFSLSHTFIVDLINAKFGRLWIVRREELQFSIEREREEVIKRWDRGYEILYQLFAVKFRHFSTSLIWLQKSELFVLLCFGAEMEEREREIKRFMKAISGGI